MAALLRLLTRLAPLLSLVRAKVVNDFDNNWCGNFFYKNTPPQVRDCDSCPKICQIYKNVNRFATLYDQEKRSPIYSAYVFNHKKCSTAAERRKAWFIEPQLINRSYNVNMAPPNNYRDVEDNQAVDGDYKDTAYDRGHLNPNLYQCNEGRTATFTLTNAVPLDACFNRLKWYNYERHTKAILQEKCPSPSTAYLITGAVPSDLKIPISPDDKLDDETRTFDRISVPLYLWTAVCCDHLDKDKKFSFGYFGKNVPEIEIRPLTIEELENELKSFYSYNNLGLFAGKCDGNVKVRDEIIQILIKKNIRTYSASFSEFPESIPPAKRRLLENGLSNVYSSGTGNKRVNVDNIDLTLQFSDDEDFFHHAALLENESSLACIMTKTLGKANELKSTSDSSKSGFYCRLEEQRHNQDAITQNGIPCRSNSRCGYYTYSYSWCWTTYSNDWAYCCTSKCNYSLSSQKHICQSGDTLIDCSPSYSVVTVSGIPCRYNFPCGYHGQSYFWCYTDSENNWDYCCAPNTYCGKHSCSYNWCYTDMTNNNYAQCADFVAPYYELEERPPPHISQEGDI